MYFRYYNILYFIRNEIDTKKNILLRSQQISNVHLYTNKHIQVIKNISRL